MGPAQRVHRAVKRIGVRLQLVQQLPNVGQGFVIEAAASLAHVDEPALVIVEPKHNGAEIGTAALGLGWPLGSSSRPASTRSTIAA